MPREGMRSRPFIRAALALICVAGVWLLGTWVTSAPASVASNALLRLTF
jgi:phosphate/sulfate permease